MCALEECEQEFTPKYKTQRCCCEKHGKLLYNRESRADGRQQREPWNDARKERYHRRRALKKAASTGNPVRFSEIAERDQWNCGICGGSVDASTEWPHPLSPSLDHVVALTKGGIHDPANVQLAHLNCNTIKSNRDGLPLLLTG
ncbi:HNH endonuclease [Streptosporangium vulgare]|uniref:HNH endonuclease n=1 Tax=Streptosporangium vulgare TaxID=46190 RepID=A0ABV5TQ25_9ACTN